MIDLVLKTLVMCSNLISCLFPHFIKPACNPKKRLFVEVIGVLDIHYESKSYKFSLLGKLVFNNYQLMPPHNGWNSKYT